jgi:hypothetical protein
MVYAQSVIKMNRARSRLEVEETRASIGVCDAIGIRLVDSVIKSVENRKEGYGQMIWISAQSFLRETKTKTR